MATSDEIYGKDIAFKSDFVRSAKGDFDTISGLANLKERIVRRVVTQPGSIVHRPTYGVGLKSYLNGLSSLAIQQRLALKIKAQIEEDPGVEEFRGLRVEESDENPGQFILYIKVKPVGYAEQSLSISEAA